MTTVILVSGKAEHGKSLFAHYLTSKYESEGKKVLRVAFAKYLKFIAEEYYEWDGEKDEEGRELLQQVGTDTIRKREPNFWADSLFALVEVLAPDFDYIIADDCRFPNEVEVFKNSNLNTIAIRVIRLDYENSLTNSQRLHPSETALDSHEFDYYVFAKDRADLAKGVLSISTYFGL